MLVGINKSTTTKNAGKSLAILIAMRMTRGTLPNGAHSWLHAKPLDATMGEWLRHTPPPAAMFIDFEWNTQNTNKKQLLACN